MIPLYSHAYETSWTVVSSSGEPGILAIPVTTHHGSWCEGHTQGVPALCRPVTDVRDRARQVMRYRAYLQVVKS